MPNEEIARPSSISVLDEQECLALLATTTVGRIAFVNAEGQQLLPLNFAATDGVIYFRTADDSVLAELALGNANVAFEVDHHGASTRDGWNVTVRGATARVTDPKTVERVIGIAKLRPWAPGERGVVIALTPASIAGRRVSSH